MNGASRAKRRHKDDPVQPPRTDFERDRDRLLHTTALRRLGSTLIRRYIRAIELNPNATTSAEPCVKRREFAEREVRLLKELTWQYVIINPALARVQFGQCSIIEHLFKTFMNAAASRAEWKLFPGSVQENLTEATNGDRDSKQGHGRIVADFISGLTEYQAVELHQRLTGSATGSVLYSSV